MQIMSNSGTALLGIGRGCGPDRAEEAIYDAINTPLLQGHAIQVGAAFSELLSGSSWRGVLRCARRAAACACHVP
jgi:hypothetical protein